MILLLACTPTPAEQAPAVAMLDSVPTDSPTDSEPPAIHGGHDLDGDGLPDTLLSVEPCPDDDGASTCLVVDSRVVTTEEVRLADLPDACTAMVPGAPSGGTEVRLIGDHGDDGLSEVSVVHCPYDGTSRGPTVSVVDLAAGTLSASTETPAGVPYGFVAHPADPEGLLHPVLAPSYGDGLTSAWGTAHVYRAELGGFVDVAVPASPEFREAGGVVQDVDGDGWEDIALVYHGMVWWGSPSTLAEIVRLDFDVAASTEPASPADFHSGRNYGTHAAFSGDDSTLRTLIVGGAPLGSFTDTNCNVSRFVALLDQSGEPGSRRLAWSHYYGFASTIFATYDPAYTSNPAADVARAADVMDGCVHRFSDSRTVMDGERAVMVNYFDQLAPYDLCLDEQWALYQDPAWTEEKATAWYDCFATNVASEGTWSMQLFRESDGVGLTGGQGHYVWGWSDALVEGDEVLYLVEVLPGTGRFDLADRASSALQVWTLEAGLWQAHSAFPVPGRPTISGVYPTGALGLGSFSSVSELTLEDQDGDGLFEVQLDDGSWVGWEGAAFTVK